MMAKKMKYGENVLSPLFKPKEGLKFKVSNVLNTLTLKYIFWKRKTFFKKL